MVNGEKEIINEVLDGDDMNYDIHKLIPYIWNHGNSHCAFPDSLMVGLAEKFLEKHRK